MLFLQLDCANVNFDESKWKVNNFSELIKDLSVSNFQLVADSLDSLKDLIESIASDKTVPDYEPVKEVCKVIYESFGLSDHI